VSESTKFIHCNAVVKVFLQQFNVAVLWSKRQN